MATDVDVQYFSHLNGLVLGNNWGDLIRLLDKALVTGVNFTQITAASIDAQGDVHITLFAAHNAMLFQVVELSGFTPNSLNQKYRIKGVPNTTQLILKPALDITERSITTTGNGKLASLGYDIIFRDTNNVKRVYRAKNPTAQHPFIRVDESLASPNGSSGVYNSTYAKYAMVGLLEHMEHIDDFENPNVLQLPFSPTDPAKNWKITGTGTGVIRGWSRWYWNRNIEGMSNQAYDTSSANRSASFTLTGNRDSFYFLRAIGSDARTSKTLSGAGLFSSSVDGSVIPPWFLMTALTSVSAGTYQQMSVDTPGATPMVNADFPSPNIFFVSKWSLASRLNSHTSGLAITPTYTSGNTNFASGFDWSGIEIPFRDGQGYMRGTLNSVLFLCNPKNISQSTPTISDNSMYVADAVNCNHSATTVGAFLFYLGELE